MNTLRHNITSQRKVMVSFIIFFVLNRGRASAHGAVGLRIDPSWWTRGVVGLRIDPSWWTRGVVGLRIDSSWWTRGVVGLRIDPSWWTRGVVGLRIDPSWWTHWRKEGNILFTNALYTFYLRLYGVRHMVKDHSNSERGNPLPPHRLLFQISSKGYFICIIPQTGLHIPRPLLHQSWSPWRIDPTTHRTMSERSYHGATSRSGGLVEV